MNDGELQIISYSQHWILVKLAVALRKWKNSIKRSASGVPVIRGLIDPYMQNAIALDHSLTVIGKWVVEICFIQL